MKSPCRGCHMEHEDKNAPRCRNCALRIQYCRQIGTMSHSMPDHLCDYRRGIADPRKETHAMPDTQAAKTEAPAAPAAHKTCKTCGETKAIDQYYKHPQTKDGINNHCKDCVKQRRLQARKAKSARPAAEPAPTPAPAPEDISSVITPDISPAPTARQTPGTASAGGSDKRKIARLAAMLAGRKMWTRAELMEIRDLCFAIQRDIDTYLVLAGIFAGHATEEAPHA